MYSEPTISPTFVVRQKRKLIRHPLIIGAIICGILFVVIGFTTLITRVITDANPPLDPEPEITFESRIVYQTTPSAEITTEPDIIIQAPVIITPQPLENDEQLTPSSTINEQPRCQITSTGDANVNIRSGPDMQFSLISVLQERDTVSAIAVSDNLWFQILNKDGTIGWVGGSVVDENGDCDDLPQVKTPVCSIENTTGNRVNIRDRASTDSNIIRTLTTDDRLMADGRTADGWYRILISGELGWIFQGVVALSDACETLAVISASEATPQPAIQQTSIAFDADDCIVESFTGNTIDLRQGPGMEFAVVAKMNKAMVAKRLSTNGWYEINGFGWAFAGDLVYSGLCNLLPTVSPEEVRGTLVIVSGG